LPVLPFSMVVALVLLVLLARAIVSRESHVTLLVLISACAVQSMILALHQYYGLAVLRYVQPVTAMCIPPLAWFAFSYVSQMDVSARRRWLHATGPVLAIIALSTEPQWLDGLIPLSFALYGAAMLFIMAQGEDSLLHSPLGSGRVALLAWLGFAMSLIASAIGDLLIAWSYASGQKQTAMMIAGVLSSLALFSLGALSMTDAVRSRRSDEGEEPAVAKQEDIERHHAIVAALDQYMEKHKPFLDPDLTLSRLARKLVVPTKDLSAAINRVKGENVSRFINRQRVVHACGLLDNGVSVTTAMLESGFNTKSNFNREFLRVKGAAPSKWRA
jgi:AraC-like DNA-binding protein